MYVDENVNENWGEGLWRRMLRELVRTVRKIHNAAAADNPDLDGPIY